MAKNLGNNNPAYKSEQNHIPNLPVNNYNNNISQGNVINVGGITLNINVGGITVNNSNNFLSNNSIMSSISNVSSSKGESNTLERINVTVEPGASIANATTPQYKGEVSNVSTSINTNFKPSDDTNAIQFRVVREYGEVIKKGNNITLVENSSLKVDILTFTAPGKFKNESKESAKFKLIKFKGNEADTSKFQDIIEIICDGNKVIITGIYNHNGNEQLIKDQCILQNCESMLIAGNNSDIDHDHAS